MAGEAAAAWRRTRDETIRILRRAEHERTGLLAALIVLVVCLVVNVALWWPLKYPPRWISELFGIFGPSGCFQFTAGSWRNTLCGIGLAVWAMSGTILVTAVILRFHKVIRRSSERLLWKLPGETHFLWAPVVATAIFTMAWASVPFHPFRRFGLVWDGVFPALVGLATYALLRYTPLFQKRAESFLATRDALHGRLRAVIAAGIVILIAVLLTRTGLLSPPPRDQVIALLSLLVTFVLFVPRRGDEPYHKPHGGPTAALLVFLAFTLALAPTVAAQIESSCFAGYDVSACEQAEHGESISVASGAIAVASVTASLLVAAPAALPGLTPTAGGSPERAVQRTRDEDEAGAEAEVSDEEPDLEDAPLVDPWDGRPVYVQRGDHQGGKPGDYWWDDVWLDRSAAEDAADEARAAMVQRGAHVHHVLLQLRGKPGFVPAPVADVEAALGLVGAPSAGAQETHVDRLAFVALAAAADLVQEARLKGRLDRRPRPVALLTPRRLESRLERGTAGGDPGFVVTALRWTTPIDLRAARGRLAEGLRALRAAGLVKEARGGDELVGMGREIAESLSGLQTSASIPDRGILLRAQNAIWLAEWERNGVRIRRVDAAAARVWLARSSG